MSLPLMLASGSATRIKMLTDAGVDFDQESPRIDEESIKASLLAEATPPRDIADALADAKAAKIANKHPNRLVLGSDQVLDLGGEVISKPESKDHAAEQLGRMQGTSHIQWSAAVLYEDAKPIWRFVDRATLHMRPLTEDQIANYLDHVWPDVASSVGAYHIEGRGVRLFHRIDGNHFTILGLPLIPLLSYLSLRGVIDT